MITGEQVDRAARLIYQLRHPEGDPIGGEFEGPSWAEVEMRDAQATARALAEAGLLAPVPLTEEWAAIDDDGNVLMRYGADSHSPHREYGTSLTYSRWASDWKHYDEGDGRAER